MIVMQQNDVPRLRPVCCAPCLRLRCRLHPIVTGIDAPQHDGHSRPPQAQLLAHRQASFGRTHQSARTPGYLFQQLFGSSDFVEEFGRTGLLRIGMGKGVIAKIMAGANYPFDDVPILGGFLANEEKSGNDPPAIQQLEKLRCSPGIWSVVESQRNFGTATIPSTIVRWSPGQEHPPWKKCRATALDTLADGIHSDNSTPVASQSGYQSRGTSRRVLSMFLSIRLSLATTGRPIPQGCQQAGVGTEFVTNRENFRR